MIVTLLIIVLIIIGVIIMAAIDNLNQAVLDLSNAVNNLSIPTSDDGAIQAAADSINASIAILNSKIS